MSDARIDAASLNAIARLTDLRQVRADVVASLVAELRASWSECEKLRAALSQISTGATPCDRCGEPHRYVESGSVSRAGSWEAEDGHPYRPIDFRETAERALAEFGQQPTGDEQ